MRQPVLGFLSPSLSSLPPIVLHSQRRDCFSPMQMKFMAAGAARPGNILSSVKIVSHFTWILSLLIFLSGRQPSPSAFSTSFAHQEL